MGELRCRLILKSGGYGFPLIRPGEVSFITYAMWLHTLMEEGRRAVLEAVPHFLGRGLPTL